MTWCLIHFSNYLISSTSNMATVSWRKCYTSSCCCGDSEPASCPSTIALPPSSLTATILIDNNHVGSLVVIVSCFHVLKVIASQVCMIMRDYFSRQICWPTAYIVRTPRQICWTNVYIVSCEYLATLHILMCITTTDEHL